MRALRTPYRLLRALGLLAAVMGLAMCGCSGSKKAAPVSGRVFVGESPAAHAVVVFHPVNAKPDAPRPTAVTDDQGRFTLTTLKEGDGAPPGEYTVTVAAYQSIESPNGDSIVVNLLPVRYAKPETSDLKATVSKGKAEVGPLNLEPR
jgi:hypothetical protein